MARVNAYLRAGNDSGRQVSVGGRSCSDAIWAHLNTDNRAGSDCGMKVSARVTGRGLRAKERRKKDIGDDRETVFTVELPEPNEACTVIIEPHGAALRALAGIGAILCAMKGAEVAEDNPEYAEKCFDMSAETIGMLEARLSDLPEVILPGGVTLAHALACVEAVRRSIDSQGSN